MQNSFKFHLTGYNTRTLQLRQLKGIHPPFLLLFLLFTPEYFLFWYVTMFQLGKHLSWVIWWLLESYAYQNADIHTQAGLPPWIRSSGTQVNISRVNVLCDLHPFTTQWLQKDCGDTWKPQVQALIPLWHTPLPQIKFVQCGRAHVLLGGTSAILMWLLPGEGALGLHLCQSLDVLYVSK